MLFLRVKNVYGNESFYTPRIFGRLVKGDDNRLPHAHGGVLNGVDGGGLKVGSFYAGWFWLRCSRVGEGEVNGVGGGY